MKKYSLINWYVIQTRSGFEHKVKDRIEKTKIDNLLTLLPKRKLWIRRKGNFFYEIKPLFPGYFFIQVKMDPLIARSLKKVSGVLRILGNQGKPKTVPSKEMKIILSLMLHNQIIPPSKIFFLNERVKVIAGPLFGMEGKIVSVDRRKKRIKIRLPFFNVYKDVYLGFELVEKA
ncbi:MAG: antiterminator LoaP [Spirochaetes bacterium]|nr:antiterminator LoaP [Spirochaetota bacterium]